ncbi:integration host factor subunit alpha [Gammaproteobacteria bacterium]|nr:integration host factor subunit alpha [Gammaproteobacteria bacterium]
MALTKADIANRLFEEIGLTKRESKEIVELFFHQISDSLATGQQVKISGFGNFELHNKKERPGRNPKTGEMIPVSARRVVTFRGGQKLRSLVEHYEGKCVDDKYQVKD